MRVADSHLSNTLSSARLALVTARTADGHWEGHLSSSALSTSTAVIAFSLFAERGSDTPSTDRALAERGIDWLLSHQNEDGGWGDTDRSFSNISTTALGWAALAMAGSKDAVASAEQRAAAWLAAAAGGIDPISISNAIVMRYGNDRTFSVPILTACTLAGRLGSGSAAWRLIPQLPFELSVVPRRFFSVLSLPVVSYALPALIAMGLVRHRQHPSSNPLARVVRNVSSARALTVLERLQPSNGAFLEAAPLTSFVAMSLVAAGHARHAVVRRAIDFLRASVRDDGSWPIDTNLATWLTALSIQALNAGSRLAACIGVQGRGALREWLLAQQTQTEHPYTGATPGAWSWTNRPGGVPDADDTAAVLLALTALGSDEQTLRAATRGVEWLLAVQNRDGGIPTFCRGWGALPFDRSGADLTAHAIRAWLAWWPALDPPLQRRIDGALIAALRYLTRAQRADGAFEPLWFGNQHARTEENLTYGTSRVLLAFGATHKRDVMDVRSQAGRAIHWLQTTQNPDGGWGGDSGTPSTIEETALAITALAEWREHAGARSAAERGAAWIATATEHGSSFTPSPIGLYFAKLGYYEKLYPMVFVTGALEALSSQP